MAANRGMEPAKLTKLVRGELDWIVMKALEKDRNRRYETASAFAADVQRYLHDEPVQACPPSAWYRFRKFARRNRRAVATAAAAALAVVLAVAGLATSTLLIAPSNGRREVKPRPGRTTAARHLLPPDRPGPQRAVRGQPGPCAVELLGECPEDLREWEWHYLMRLCRVEPLVLRDKTEVNSVAFSPDGEHLASAGGDGTVKVWNSRTGEVVQTLGTAHADSVVTVAFHPDGKHLASVGADETGEGLGLDDRPQWSSTGPCDVVHKFGTAYAVAFSPPTAGSSRREATGR